MLNFFEDITMLELICFVISLLMCGGLGIVYILGCKKIKRKELRKMKINIIKLEMLKMIIDQNNYDIKNIYSNIKKI